MSDMTQPASMKGLLGALSGDQQFSAILAPAMGRLILRGDHEVARLAGEALGVACPLTALGSASHGTNSALWLGPDEWLLLTAAGDLSGFGNRLAMDLGDVPHSLVDVSHRQLGFELKGRLAARVLTSGCPLDLGLRAFPVGTVTRTLFHKAEVVLWRRADGFHLEVWRSFAPYVLGHLLAARRAAEGLQDNALPPAG